MPLMDEPETSLEDCRLLGKQKVCGGVVEVCFGQRHEAKSG